MLDLLFYLVYLVQTGMYYGVSTLLLLKLPDVLVYNSNIVAQKPKEEEIQEYRRMIEYSSSCYSSNFKIGDATFCKSDKTDAEAYIWYTNSELYIVFRGTEDPKDVLYDLNVLTTTIDPGVFVHKGFLEQFLSIEPLLTTVVEKYVANGGKKVILTGHSLGGALSSIAAYHYSKIYQDLDIFTYTFGSPRVGNTTFAENKCHSQGCRVYNYQDLVPMVPFTFRFEHVNSPTVCLVSNTAKYTEHDVAWYYRLFSFFRVNVLQPIQPHFSATYLNVLNSVKV